MKATDGYTDQESMGMQLLKKGRRGLGKVLFSRAGLVALLLLLQIAILIGVQVRFKAFLPHYTSLYRSSAS